MATPLTKARSGIALYTFHKYQKNISSPDPLDSSETAETANPAQPRFYAMANSEIQPLHLPGPAAERVPLASLNSSTALDRQRHAYPPEEGGEDGTNRLRDDFEGWNDREAVSEDDDSEVGEEEGERRRNERDGKDSGGKSWGTWWEKEM
jgi:solute carrier family 35 protein C2